MPLMVTTCQTDADVGASDIERPGGPTCLAETCGVGSCVGIEYRLSDLGMHFLSHLRRRGTGRIDHLDGVVLAQKAHGFNDGDAAGPSSDQAPPAERWA